ncbi:MAG: zinc ribbon domain-containing protein [Chloroflexi bacterium]|nr:zinc ribbon domain-containing protein [Chloroflexota bacterium]
MNCPNCGTSNSEDAAFCSQCGRTLSRPNSEGPTVHGPLSSEVPSLPTPGDPTPPDAIMPSTLSQLVNHTLGIYQRNLRPLLGIWAPPMVPLLLGAFVTSDGIRAFLLLVFFFTLIVAVGATAYLVASFYANLPISTGRSYLGAMNNGAALLVNALVYYVVVWTALGLSTPYTAFVGVPVLIFVLVSWAFFSQVTVLENRKAMEGLSRSWALVKGFWWRVFRIGVVCMLALSILSLPLLFPAILVMDASPLASNLLMTLWLFLAFPLYHIGVTLVYFDLRARKEDLTLSRLALELQGEASPSDVFRRPPPEGPGSPL